MEHVDITHTNCYHRTESSWRWRISKQRMKYTLSNKKDREKNISCSRTRKCTFNRRRWGTSFFDLFFVQFSFSSHSYHTNMFVVDSQSDFNIILSDHFESSRRKSQRKTILSLWVCVRVCSCVCVHRNIAGECIRIHKSAIRVRIA